MANDDRSHRDRLAIIQAVKTPLSFFTLALLVVEVILGIMASRATGRDFTILLTATVALPFLLVVVVAYQFRSPVSVPAAPQQAAPVFKYDAFVSAPMAAVDDTEYEQVRKLAQTVVTCLQKDCGKKSIYYAGANIATRAEFEPNDAAVQEDIDAISHSEYFIMVYPAKIVSSVLFEAGYAVALNKKSIYFVKNARDLPFVMRRAEQALASVKLYDYDEVDDIVKVLKNRKCFEFVKWRRDSLTDSGRRQTT